MYFHKIKPNGRATIVWPSYSPAVCSIWSRSNQSTFCIHKEQYFFYLMRI